MQADKKKSLEERLRQLIQADRKTDLLNKPQPKEGNVIRRRKGKADERFFSKMRVDRISA